jgi:hypothetical protein
VGSGHALALPARPTRRGDEGRVLVTNNAPDFESLRRAHEAAGNEVPGLIYTSDPTFPRTKAYMSRLVAALAAAVAGPETVRCGGVLWLRPARVMREGIARGPTTEVSEE